MTEQWAGEPTADATRVPLQLELSPEELRALDRACERTRRTRGSLVREAVRRVWLGQRAGPGRPLPPAQRSSTGLIGLLMSIVTWIRVGKE
jgi:hypothetical protein